MFVFSLAAVYKNHNEEATLAPGMLPSVAGWPLAKRSHFLSPPALEPNCYGNYGQGHPEHGKLR